MVEVLGMLDLTLDRVRLVPAPTPRRPAVPGRRRLAAIVRFHTLYFISPLSVPLAHVLQLLRAPARMGMDGRLRALHSGHVSRHTRGHEGCVE
jgi:hypothetical protein